MRKFRGNEEEDRKNFEPADQGRDGNARSLGRSHRNRRGTNRTDARGIDTGGKIGADVELGHQNDESEH